MKMNETVRKKNREKWLTSVLTPGMGNSKENSSKYLEFNYKWLLKHVTLTNWNVLKKYDI